jgi:hypothetical protein
MPERLQEGLVFGERRFEPSDSPVWVRPPLGAPFRV